MINTDYMLTLLADFPPAPVSKNSAITGVIPMWYFTLHEKDIRREMRYQGLMVFYRGPRKSNDSVYPTHTRRCDATGVLLYNRR